MGRSIQAMFAGMLLAVSGAGAGCRSAFVGAELRNETTAPLTVVEVDYPSASFGTQSLAPGATFRYRFKILGSGPTKLTYTDNKGHDHTATGPTLNEGAAGSLTIRIGPTGVAWEPRLSTAK